MNLPVSAGSSPCSETSGWCLRNHPARRVKQVHNAATKHKMQAASDAYFSASLRYACLICFSSASSGNPSVFQGLKLVAAYSINRTKLSGEVTALSAGAIPN